MLIIYENTFEAIREKLGRLSKPVSGVYEFVREASQIT